VSSARSNSPAHPLHASTCGTTTKAPCPGVCIDLNQTGDYEEHSELFCHGGDVVSPPGVIELRVVYP
jgi:hypothetical protein